MNLLRALTGLISGPAGAAATALPIDAASNTRTYTPAGSRANATATTEPAYTSFSNSVKPRNNYFSSLCAFLCKSGQPTLAGSELS